MDVDNILWKCNTLMSLPENRSLAVIKSNLMFKCVEAAEEQRQKLDTGSLCCKWCLNLWTPNNCTIALQPQKKPKHHLRSLLKKDFNTLNKFQQKWVTKLKNQPPTNKMAFKCHTCNKETLVPLKKENILPKIETEQNVLPLHKSKKSKKKRKDKYAGLNVAVIESFKQFSEPVKKPQAKLQYVNKPPKKMNVHQQKRIYQTLQNAPQLKKKPSLLATFLDNM